MERKALDYRQSSISYLRFGEGERLLIAFHGFGDRATMWCKVEEGFSADFTVIALDLPFHGATIWNEGVFSSFDFAVIVQAILSIENKERFSLAGFSFGARIVESLFLRFPKQVDRIYFFAPDGFGTKGMFATTMTPRPIRRFIKWILSTPQWFLTILSFFYKLKIINRFVYAFISNHLGSEKRRERLFSYWLSIDDFVIKPQIFKTQLVQSDIPTYIFFAENDDIIPLSSGQWLAENAPNIRLHIVTDGHKLVNEKRNEILRLLCWN